MTIAFGSIGAKSSGGTTTVSVAYPASPGSGDIAICGRVGWLNSITFTDEAGWTPQGSATGGTGTSADAHTVGVRADTRELSGSETGSVTFDQGGTISGAMGVMARYTKDPAKGWSIANNGDADTSHGANRAFPGTVLDLAPGDVVVAIVATDTDTALTITSPTFTATGITFGTVTRRTPATAGVLTGVDGNVEIFDVDVVSGSGSVSVAFSFTTATSQCGAVQYVRLREVVVPGPSITAFTTADFTGTTTPKTITVTGAVTGDLILVQYGGDNFGNQVTAASVSTTGGSTGAWTEVNEDFGPSSNSGWVSNAWALVTADGTVTISLARTQSSGQVWGGQALLAHNHGGIGNVLHMANGSAETGSLTTSADSAVGGFGVEWDHLTVSQMIPAGAIDVHRTDAETAVSWYGAYWRAQAAGTRSYGIDTNSTANFVFTAIEILANTGGGTTPIGDELSISWDARSAVGASLISTWDLRAAVSDSLVGIWDVRALVNDQIALLWDAREVLGDTLALLYDVREALGDTLALLWDIRGAIGDDLVLSWDVIGPIAKELSLTWDIRSMLGDTLNLSWDARSVVSRDTVLIWDLRAALGDNLLVAWDVRSATGDVLVLSWDVRGAMGDSISLLWDTRSPIGQAVALLWDVQADTLFATKDLALLWNVSGPQGKDLSVVWDARALLGDNLGIVWDIRAMLNDSLALLWDARSVVGDTVALSWDVRATAGDNLALLWHISTLTGKELTVVWDVQSDVPEQMYVIVAEVLPRWRTGVYNRNNGVVERWQTEVVNRWRVEVLDENP